MILSAAPGHAADPVSLEVVIKDHRFEPAELRVPANTPVTIDVRNEDDTAEEFDSSDLGVEKVIAGKHKGTIRVRALAPGRYAFMGEYHAETAKGVLVAE
jgi:plastocyanin